MMMSTPVRCSSARMLRPSRPMMRPFMSSDGSSTSETVVSAAWLAATRWRASATRLRARRRASDCASSSSWRTRRASSWRTSSSERVEDLRLRLVHGHAGDALQLDRLPDPSPSSAPPGAGGRAPRGRRSPCSRRSSSVTRRSNSPSFDVSRSWARTASACRVLTSRSSSSRTRADSSFASSWASRRSESASRRASCSSSCRVRRAAASLEPPVSTSRPNASAAPTTRPMMMPMTIAMLPLGSTVLRRVPRVPIRRRAGADASRESKQAHGDRQGRSGTST